MSGPLSGLRVVELAGIGPGPHAAMMLSDLGADVVRVVRPTTPEMDYTTTSHVLRGRTTVLADLKRSEDVERVYELVAVADVLIEGFRPGVAERLGLGPDEFTTSNPQLVYARMTGWGQSGPLANTAGHDINYISLTGVLDAIGPTETPLPPLNFVGDYGGGSMFLVTGILAALHERHSSRLGQVVDAAMIDGVSALAQPIHELRAIGAWEDGRSQNILDGAAPFYRTYECSDGRFMAVGAVEPQFWTLVLSGLGLKEASLPARDDRATWPDLCGALGAAFLQHDRDHWVKIFDRTDACVTPVLTFSEAPSHPHVAARGALVGAGNDIVAASAPRFSRTPGRIAEGTPSTMTALDTAVKHWTS
ncbi:CoA transferase (plasmid) [Rhodococcus erythropolis]|uniref:CaiB/BaiF CoA transferase family protein n=1 Tax=Rhodococcus TaxID=1827 RepID=UPI001247BB26|nr:MULTISPECIES: CaiB/BaiF CoA-transferase family protein [Rhodococcus]MCJ0949912.1 CoA transferase [Rhodococcus sp. ARC_M8]MDJ0441218.1 CaiB/BaiF CoA-transferase family protein [Rhodococcus qingshengii]QEX08429.1 CoA transferase [Rhodococcus erythropolis]